MSRVRSGSNRRSSSFPLFAVAIASLTLVPAVASAQTGGDLARLAHPAVAERLDLDDTQRAKIQALLQQRTETRLIEDVAKRDEKVSEIEQQIVEVLREEQRERWEDDRPSGDLEFQFREQSWPDVLQWFARQEGLTLIMDREPPGTFTYTDTRRYTSAEAIDLLNSVLLTRGFTLVRREKMLTVLQLSSTIPIELVPEVTLEELASRGRFELVRVNFALGSRPVDAVMKEVSPYLGQYGRAIPLAQSRRLVVIEAAGKMETINLLINSVPEPKKPAPKKQPEKPPKPIFAAYPLGELEPEATLDAMRKLVASEQITVDERTGLLSAYLVPGQQVAIQSAIEQMRTSVEESPDVTSVAYRLSGADTDLVREQVDAVAPDAVVSIGREGGRLLVTAPPSDQEKVAEVLEALGLSRSATDRPTLAFRVDAAQATQLASSLQAMLPASRVVGNTTLGTIVVHGPADELELAEEVIRQWRGEGERTTKSLRSFPMNPTELERFEQLREGVVQELTDVRIVVESAMSGRPSRLLAWASTEDLQWFEGLIEQIRDATPDEALVWPRRYELPDRDADLAIQLIESRFPGVRVAEETGSDRVTVWAAKEDQDQIATLLEALRAELPSERPMTIETYSVPGLQASELRSFAASILESVDGVSVTEDEDQGRLLVRADAETHSRLDELVEAFRTPVPSDQEKVLMAYTLEHADAEDAQSLIESSVRGATVVADADNGRLIVTATLAEQGRIKTILAELDRPASSTSEKQVRSYPLRELQADALLPTLQSMWPRMELSVDEGSNRVIASGTASEQEALRTAIEQLARGGEDGDLRVETYAVPIGDLRTLPSVLAQIAPQAVISTDVSNRAVVVWGSEAAHGRIERALEQLSTNTGQGDELLLFRVPPRQASSYRMMIMSLYPTARVAFDSGSGQLTVLAPKTLGKAVTELVEKRLGAEESGADLDPRHYQVPREIREAFDSLLENVAPEAELIEAGRNGGGSVVILASPDDHETITAKLEQLRDTVPPVEPQASRVFLIRQGDARALEDAAERLVPDATVIADRRSNTLIVTADEEGLAAVEALVRDFESDGAEEMVSYRLRHADAEQVADTLERAFGRRSTAGVSADVDSGVVFVVGRSDQQEIAKTLIEQVDRDDLGEATRTRVFPLARGDARAVAGAARDMAPRASISEDRSSNSVIVTADESSIEQIAQMVREVEGGDSDETVSKTYVLQQANPLSFQRALNDIYPRARVAGDSSSGGLLVSATPEQHVQIAALVDDLNSAPERSDGLVTYRLRDADAGDVADALEQAFGRRSTAGVSADVDSGFVFVVGRPDQQKVAKGLIEQMDQADQERTPRKLRIFSAAGISGTEVASAIEQLFETSRPRVEVRYDFYNEQIVVTGSEEQLERVAETIRQFEPPQRDLDIFPLDRNDPETVRDAIDSLFDELPYNVAPSVTIDNDRQQLFVRATEEQLEQIRDLLGRLGESVGGNAAPVRTGPDNRGSRVRTIPVGDDAADALRRLQRVWPTLRENPLRVVRPAADEPPADEPPADGPPADRTKIDKTDATDDNTDKDDESGNERDPEAENGPNDAASVDEPLSLQSLDGRPSADRPSRRLVAVMQDTDANTGEAGTNAGDAEASAGEAATNAGDAGESSPDAPPVLIIPGEENWTIASEDPVALQALTEWIESEFDPGVKSIAAGTNHAVFVLRYADASELQTVLTNLFRDATRRRRNSDEKETRVVADPRINALIVRGSRSDRETVGELLDVLDSPQFVGAFQPSPPQYVAVQNADAERVVEVLETVYRNELSAGGGRRPINIPTGISDELATMLRQVNASASGPLLTLSVDTLTNSVVMRAPSELADEVREFIGQIDEQTETRRARGLKIVPLKESNVGQIEQAIRALGGSGRRYRRR